MKDKENIVYDFLGIGLGPFNLGLAALVEPFIQNGQIKAIFLEKKREFSWHQGLLMDGTYLQVPFMADLVTMVRPTSPFSFLNYLLHQKRLYHFYFYERFHVPRKEYNHYCQWVASSLPFCHFGRNVSTVELVTYENLPSSIREQTSGPFLYHISVDGDESYWSRQLVLGIGNRPYVPPCFELSESVFHSANFVHHREQCLGLQKVQERQNIVVIGSGQSAAECFKWLLENVPSGRSHLWWLTRSNGFFPMEYSKLGLEHFSPDYLHYFYHLPPHKKDDLLKKQGLLYKGISFSTIGEIYDHLYEATIGGETPYFSLCPMQEVYAVEAVKGPKMGKKRMLLHLRHTQQETCQKLAADVVILGTGFEYKIPSFLEPVLPHLVLDHKGRWQVQENYQLQIHESSLLQKGRESERGTGRIFVQNGEFHTHGIGAPDLGLGPYRNANILNQLLGREVFPLSSQNIFQDFSALTSSSAITNMTNSTPKL